MKRNTTVNQSRTSTGTGKKPYVYAFASGTVAGTTGTSSAPSIKTLVKRSSDRTESMPAHWRQAVA